MGAGFIRRPCSRIQRHLMGRNEQDTVIAFDQVFGSVAVMNVKINNGDPRQPTAFQRMFGGNRDCPEQAEPHRGRGFGVMAGRAARNKSVLCIACQNHVHGLDRPANRAQGGAQGPR